MRCLLLAALVSCSSDVALQASMEQFSDVPTAGCVSDDELLFCPTSVSFDGAAAACDAVGGFIADPTSDTADDQIEDERDQFDRLATEGGTLLGHAFWTAWPHNMVCPAMLETGIAVEKQCDEVLPFVCEML